jgi:hypothetical protein
MEVSMFSSESMLSNCRRMAGRAMTVLLILGCAVPARAVMQPADPAEARPEAPEAISETDGTNWFDVAWRYRMDVTLDGAIADADLADFPVLVRVENPTLASHIRRDGADIRFTAGDGVTPLACEVSRADAERGIVEAWVRVPRLAAGRDILLYMYFGNARAEAPAAAEVWDAAYRGVWHLDAGGTRVADATVWSNTGTAGEGVLAGGAGVAGGAATFAGGSARITIPAAESLAGLDAYTIEAWYNPAEDITDSGVLADDAADSATVGPDGGEAPAILMLDGGLALVAYTDWNNDGWLKTCRVGADGTIGAAIDTLEYDPKKARFASLARVSETLTAVAYQGDGNDGYLASVRVGADGTLGDAPLDVIEFDGSNGRVPSLVRVRDDLLAVAYQGDGNDGYVCAVSIDAAGALGRAVLDRWEYDTQQGKNPSALPVGEDVLAVALQGDKGDGYIVTLGIEADGRFTRSRLDALEFDPIECVTPSLVHMGSEIYAIVYTGGADWQGLVKTVRIGADGTIGDAVLDTLCYVRGDAYYPEAIRAAGRTVAIAYTGGDEKGYLCAVTVGAAGALDDAVLDTFTFDTRKAYYPSMAVPADGMLALAYTDRDWRGRLVTVGLSASDRGIARGEDWNLNATRESAWASVGDALLEGPAPDGWTHMALTRDTDGTGRLYVEGTAVAQARTDAPESTADILAGGGFRGALDELRISAGARGAAWLAACARNQGAPDAFCTPGRTEAVRVEAPAVHNAAGATRLTDTSALLNGEITAGIPRPRVTVYWGATDGGTDPAAWSGRLDGGLQSGAFSLRLCPLERGSTVYYRCQASNGVDTAWAPESAAFRVPTNADSDADGLPDWWETLNALNPADAAPADQDSDGDGLTDNEEYIAGTDPRDAESIMDIVCMSEQGEADIRLGLRLAPERSYTLLASDTWDGPATPVANLEVDEEGVTFWTDTGAADAVTTRFYRLKAARLDAAHTNADAWAMFAQPREPNGRYLFTVPVDLGTNNTLNGELGRLLTRGLHASGATNDTDMLYCRLEDNTWKEFYLQTNASGRAVWWDYDVNRESDFAVEPGRALWLLRGSTPVESAPSTLFLGRCFRSVPAVQITTNNAVDGWAWTMIGWNLPGIKQHRNLGAGATPKNQLGFAQGGYGGQTFSSRKPHNQQGDQIWVWDGKTYSDVYWLMGGLGEAYDGRWWNERTRTYAEIKFEPGKAYIYRHHVGIDGAITGTNFWWQPQP